MNKLTINNLTYNDKACVHLIKMKKEEGKKHCPSFWYADFEA